MELGRRSLPIVVKLIALCHTSQRGRMYSQEKQQQGGKKEASSANKSKGSKRLEPKENRINKVI